MDPAGAPTATELSIYALQMHAERSGPIPLPEPRDPAIHDAASDTTYNRKTRGSEGRSAHHGAACRRPARPRCHPQSCTALPPRSGAPAAAAAPCAPPRVRSKQRRRLTTEPPAVVRHRAAAPRLREPSPVYAALPARAPCGRHLNPPSEPAGGSSYRPRPLQRGAQQRHPRWLYQSLLVARGASKFITWTMVGSEN